VEFAFDEEKNELLFRVRGVTFSMVIEAIADKGILYNFDHPNQHRYPGQESVGRQSEWIRLLRPLCRGRGHLVSQDDLPK
jgi:uncharacterized DUF497 family protein